MASKSASTNGYPPLALTIANAAALLQLSTGAFKANVLPHLPTVTIKSGDARPTIRIDRRDLEDFIDSRKRGGTVGPKDSEEAWIMEAKDFKA